MPGLRLRFANPAAAVLLRRGDGLRLSRGALVALKSADMRVLRSAVAAATGQGTDPSRHDWGGGRNNVVTIERSGYAPPYRATVLPLAQQHAVRELAPRAEVVVFIEDPDAVSPEDPAAEDLLRRAFHLTPGEARLAAHLASGISLTDAADAFGVTRNTVRAQLRSIFDKTEARRQSDLVRLLHSACSLRISLN
jgi:DNA-binding CsgD family transcriptional regulator